MMHGQKNIKSGSRSG